MPVRSTLVRLQNQHGPVRQRPRKSFVEGRHGGIGSTCGQARQVRVGDLPMPADVTELRRDVGQRIRPELAARQGMDGSEHILCDASALPDADQEPNQDPSTTGHTAKLSIPAAQADARAWCS